MRNINTNKKGNTNVEMTDARIFDSKSADYNDSNKEWDDFQLYYTEDKFRAKEKANANAEAVERGKAFVRGRLILMAIQDELQHKTRSRELETA